MLRRLNRTGLRQDLLGFGNTPPLTGPQPRFVPPNFRDFPDNALTGFFPDLTRQTDGSVLLTTRRGTGGFDIQTRLRPLPPTPYTLTACLSVTKDGTPASGEYPQAGVLWYDDSLFRLTAFGIFWDVTSYPSQLFTMLSKWDTPTVFNSSYVTGISADKLFLGDNLWLRLRDDGTERAAFSGHNGLDWDLVYNVGRTDWHTPTHAGIFGDPGGVNIVMRTRILSWDTSNRVL